MPNYEVLQRSQIGDIDSGMPDLSGIYVIRNLVSGKIYVGSAMNIRKRLREHHRCLRAAQHKNRHLQASFDKRGIQAFQAEVVEFVAPENDALLAAEDVWIARLRSTETSVGYNICGAGSTRRGVKATPETCARIGAAKIGNQNRKGAVVPQEMRDRIAAKLRGRKASDESRAHQSVARKGKKHTAEWSRRIGEAQKGKIIPQEQRDRISATLTGRKRSPEAIENSRQGILNLYASGYKKPAMSPEACAAISAKNKGRIVSAETRAKMSASRSGRTMSGDQKKAIAERMRKYWKARKDAARSSSDQS